MTHKPYFLYEIFNKYQISSTFYNIVIIKIFFSNINILSQNKNHFTYLKTVFHLTIEHGDSLTELNNISEWITDLFKVLEIDILISTIAGMFVLHQVIQYKYKYIYIYFLYI